VLIATLPGNSSGQAQNTILDVSARLQAQRAFDLASQGDAHAALSAPTVDNAAWLAAHAQVDAWWAEWARLDIDSDDGMILT
jgi:hypothetical protein